MKRPSFERMIHLAACELRDALELGTNTKVIDEGICASVRNIIRRDWWKTGRLVDGKDMMTDPWYDRVYHVNGNYYASAGPQVSNVLCRYFETWGDWSGSDAYPVPDPLCEERRTERAKRRAEDAYHDTQYNRMWDTSTDYGASRLNLLYHIIEQTKDASHELQ